MRDDTLAPVACALVAATEAAVDGSSRVSVLFSGGLDSSIVASLARATADVHLVAVGVPGSSDLRSSAEGARDLGLPLTVLEVTEEKLRERRAAEAEGLAGIPRALWGVALGISLGVEASPDEVVLCGQGADELFFGYAHFRGLDRTAMAAKAAVDWESLVARDWPWAVRRARSLGHELRSPFLAGSVVTEARALPIEPLGPGGPTKPTLRRLAARWALPEQIVQRPKRAFQYGSGIERLLRRSEPPNRLRRARS